MPDDEQAPAKLDWDDVAEDARKSVGRLARRGRVHPDPEIAAAAVEHAKGLMIDAAQWHRERWQRRVVRIPDTLFVGFFDTGFGEWLEERADRRWAERVLEADRRQPGAAGRRS